MSLNRSLILTSIYSIFTKFYLSQRTLIQMLMSWPGNPRLELHRKVTSTTFKRLCQPWSYFLMPCQWCTYDSAESASKVELFIFFPLLSLTSVMKDMCQFFKISVLAGYGMITLNIASKMIYKWIRLVCTLECVCVCAFYWTSTIH